MIDKTRVSAMQFSEFLDNFEKIGSEVDKLAELIQCGLINYLNKSEHQFSEGCEDIEYVMTDNNYFLKALCIPFNLIIKPNRSTSIGNLYIYIALQGDGCYQYDSNAREPLVHVEYSIYPKEDFFHHPVKRDRYIESECIESGQLNVENNIITTYFSEENDNSSELLMFAFSLRLFSITSNNLESILFKPIRDAIYKYVLDETSELDVVLDKDASVNIPTVNSITNEIEPFDFYCLENVIDYIENNHSFSFGQLQKELRLGYTKIRNALEVLLSLEIIVEMSHNEFELLDGMEDELTKATLRHNLTK